MCCVCVCVRVCVCVCALVVCMCVYICVHMYATLRSRHQNTFLRNAHTRTCSSSIAGKALQHTATHYNTLQHTATHCNTLQHTATHCNIRAAAASLAKCGSTLRQTPEQPRTLMTTCIFARSVACQESLKKKKDPQIDFRAASR